MAAMSIRRSVMDRLTVVQIIRGIFARSPVFSDALLSDPRVGPEGEVIVDVSFGRGPVAVRVVAPSVEEVYAILHQLASAMVEIERSRRGWSRKGRVDHETASADTAG